MNLIVIKPKGFKKSTQRRFYELIKKGLLEENRFEGPMPAHLSTTYLNDKKMRVYIDASSLPIPVEYSKIITLFPSGAVKVIKPSKRKSLPMGCELLRKLQDQQPPIDGVSLPPPRIIAPQALPPPLPPPIPIQGRRSSPPIIQPPTPVERGLDNHSSTSQFAPLSSLRRLSQQMWPTADPEKVEIAKDFISASLDCISRGIKKRNCFFYLAQHIAKLESKFNRDELCEVLSRAWDIAEKINAKRQLRTPSEQFWQGM